MTINFANSDSDLARCFPIMVQLRPQLIQSEFIDKVKHQQQSGYFLAYLEESGAIKAVAGFRLVENLVDGRLLYVDDLITEASERFKGYGSALFDWLLEHSRSLNCVSVQLDSGVQRGDAHRFYFGKRMKISSYHFKLSVDSYE